MFSFPLAKASDDFDCTEGDGKEDNGLDKRLGLTWGRREGRLITMYSIILSGWSWMSIETD
jgi:hypothetical protein